MGKTFAFCFSKHFSKYKQREPYQLQISAHGMVKWKVPFLGAAPRDNKIWIILTYCTRRVNVLALTAKRSISASKTFGRPFTGRSTTKLYRTPLRTKISPKSSTANCSPEAWSLRYAWTHLTTTWLTPKDSRFTLRSLWFAEANAMTQSSRFYQLLGLHQSVIFSHDW